MSGARPDVPTDGVRLARARPRGARALLLAVAVFVLTGLGALGWVWFELHVDRIVPPREDVLVRVPSGATLREVARDLEEQDLIGSAWELRVVARLDGRGRQVRAGEFAIARGSSPSTILRHLIEGPPLTRAITVPEGWPAERTIAVLADSLRVEADSLRELVDDPPRAWRERFGIPDGHGLEGYLFPETYRFTRGTRPREAIETMLATLDRALDDSLRARVGRSAFDLHEVVTLASIVEAEATRDDERSRIAAVYLNRLREGWKLEADPTVAFAVGKIGERLLYRDLESESPYNTYRVTGLPPGPINSPGIASIRAVLEPEPGFDAMYFVADGEGGHRFSRTWDEHRRAVEVYRQSMRERRATVGGQ